MKTELSRTPPLQMQFLLVSVGHRKRKVLLNTNFSDLERLLYQVSDFKDSCMEIRVKAYYEVFRLSPTVSVENLWSVKLCGI